MNLADGRGNSVDCQGHKLKQSKGQQTRVHSTKPGSTKFANAAAIRIHSSADSSSLIPGANVLLTSSEKSMASSWSPLGEKVTELRWSMGASKGTLSLLLVFRELDRCPGLPKPLPRRDTRPRLESFLLVVDDDEALLFLSLVLSSRSLLSSFSSIVLASLMPVLLSLRSKGVTVLLVVPVVVDVCKSEDAKGQSARAGVQTSLLLGAMRVDVRVMV